VSGYTGVMGARLTFRLHAGPELGIGERRIVRDAILFWHGERWTVHVFTVMADHVHILATSAQVSPGRWYPLASVLQSVTGFTAREINRGRTGVFWQNETYDRNRSGRGGIRGEGEVYSGELC